MCYQAKVCLEGVTGNILELPATAYGIFLACPENDLFFKGRKKSRQCDRHVHQPLLFSKRSLFGKCLINGFEHHQEIKEKSNEIPVAQKLIEELGLSGCMMPFIVGKNPSGDSLKPETT